MSGLIGDMADGWPRRQAGFAAEGQGEKGGARRKLGRNERTYYGPTLDALHAEKHGTKKLARELSAQGATTKKGRFVALGGDATPPTRVAKKLLGG